MFSSNSNVAEIFAIPRDFLDNQKFVFYAYPIFIVLGLLFNVLSIILIMKRHLSTKHSGYFYLTTISGTNVFLLVFCFGIDWLAAFEFQIIHNNIVCILRTYTRYAVYAVGWQVALLLIDVYFRIKRMQDDQNGSEGCRSRFTVKYCCFNGARSSLIVVSVFLAALNARVLWTCYNGDYYWEPLCCVISHYYDIFIFIALSLHYVVQLLTLPMLVGSIQVAATHGLANPDDEDVPDTIDDRMILLNREFIKCSKYLGIFVFFYCFTNLIRIFIASGLQGTVSAMTTMSDIIYNLDRPMGMISAVPFAVMPLFWIRTLSEFRQLGMQQLYGPGERSNLPEEIGLETHNDQEEEDEAPMFTFITAEGLKGSTGVIRV